MTLEAGHESKYTWQQTQIIAGKKIMGQALAIELAQFPDITTGISTLIRDPKITYEDILRHYLLTPDPKLHTLVASPFIQAFIQTPQCTNEEKAFLEQIKIASQHSSSSEERKDDFYDWVKSRISFMAGGLQRCVLDSGLIEPLSDEEAIRKSQIGYRLWREANPSRVAEISRLGTQAAAEIAQPRTYTLEVRQQMQAWFDKGLDYETVRELLIGSGINVSTKSLIATVSYYDDLSYTLDKIKEERRQGYYAAMREIYELTSSRHKTVTILEKLGYNPRTTAVMINRLGLRERIDWTGGVEIDGRKIKLEDLMLEFTVKNYPTIKEEHQAFVAYLQSNGINTNITYGSYHGRRHSIL